MIRGNNINRFLRGCSDHRDQLFCLFELKELPWPYGWNLGWRRFFFVILNFTVRASVPPSASAILSGGARSLSLKFKHVVKPSSTRSMAERKGQLYADK